MEGYGTLVRLKNVEQAEDAFKKLKSLGFSYCQLVYKPQCYDMKNAQIISDAARNQGVSIVSFFAGYFDNFTKWDLFDDYKTAGINSKKYGKPRLKYIKSAANFANAIGVKDILIHAGFVANNPFSKEYKYMKSCVKNFASYCKSMGVNVLLETGGESPITLLRLIEDVGLGNVYVNLDTANLIMYGYGNPVDAIYTLNKHIKSIHLKDGVPPTNTKKTGEEKPIGQGFVDFSRVFEQLNYVGFNGPIIIEREIEGEKQQEDLKNAVEYLNRKIFCQE